MENRRASVVVFYFCLYFSFEVGFSLELLCHTKRHGKFIFTYPHFYLKRQIDVLRDKIDMDIAP